MNHVEAQNSTVSSILKDLVLVVIGLFCFGFGVYLTIQANIGAAPWDVFMIGTAKTLGIQYGNVSVAMSLVILCIDILLREPIGLAMIFDAILVGKTVDLFNAIELFPLQQNPWIGLCMMVAGLVIDGYAQWIYMKGALGCGPRDTLLVGLKRRLTKIPIGIVSIGILAVVTLCGYLLGGPVGIGTLVCAFATGPIMQLTFATVHFSATDTHHQNILESIRVFRGKK